MQEGPRVQQPEAAQPCDTQGASPQQRPWCLKPSVGTWLRPLPRRPAVPAAATTAPEADFARWSFAPPSLPLAAAEHKALEDEGEEAAVTDDIVPEMMLFADIVGKGKAGKGDDISPSTCATETPSGSSIP